MPHRPAQKKRDRAEVLERLHGAILEFVTTGLNGLDEPTKRVVHDQLARGEADVAVMAKLNPCLITVLLDRPGEPPTKLFSVAVPTGEQVAAARKREH